MSTRVGIYKCLSLGYKWGRNLNAISLEWEALSPANGKPCQHDTKDNLTRLSQTRVRGRAYKSAYYSYSNAIISPIALSHTNFSTIIQRSWVEKCRQDKFACEKTKLYVLFVGACSRFGTTFFSLQKQHSRKKFIFGPDNFSGWQRIRSRSNRC